VRHELLTLLLAQELSALRQEFLLLVVALARRRLPLLSLIGGLGRGRLLLHLLLVSHGGAVLLDPLLEHLEHLASLLEALALLKEALVQLRQMEFFLPIGQRLKLHEIAVSLSQEVTKAVEMQITSRNGRVLTFSFIIISLVQFVESQG